MSACEKNAPFLFFSPPLCNPGDGAYSYFKHLKHLKRQHFELVINNFFPRHHTWTLRSLLSFFPSVKHTHRLFKKGEKKKETKDEGFTRFTRVAASKRHRCRSSPPAQRTKQQRSSAYGHAHNACTYLSSHSPSGTYVPAQPCKSIHEQNFIFIFHVLIGQVPQSTNTLHPAHQTGA